MIKETKNKISAYIVYLNHTNKFIHKIINKFLKK